MHKSTMDRYNKVRSLIEKGYTETRALARVGMSPQTFRKIKSGTALVPVENKATPHYIDMVAREEANVVIVVCKPDQIRHILGELK